MCVCVVVMCVMVVVLMIGVFDGASCETHLLRNNIACPYMYSTPLPHSHMYVFICIKLKL